VQARGAKAAAEVRDGNRCRRAERKLLRRYGTKTGAGERGKPAAEVRAETGAGAWGQTCCGMGAEAGVC